MKKFFLGLTKTLLIGAIFLVNIFGVRAQIIEMVEPVDVYVFYSNGCPHCAKEIEYLSKLVRERPNVKVSAYEVSQNRANALLLGSVADFLNVEVGGVPFTVIGSQYFPGFRSAETTGLDFEAAIDKVVSGEDKDVLAAKFFGGVDDEKHEPSDSEEPVTPEGTVTEETKEENTVNPEDKIQDKEDKDTSSTGQLGGFSENVKLPIFGEINTKELSLPILTLVIALVDGFNPCAMWVLLFLISMLLGYKDRKRMWILGTTFIAASAFVYFLFMAAWLNLFLVIGYLSWIRWIVGIVALYFGYKNIKSFLNKDSGCEVTKDEKRVKTLEKIKEITKSKNLLPAIGGIVLLAFAVNLIEAVCSAALPAVYTQVLSLNNLSKLQYYMYILLYQIIFMLDDMVIFAIAMITLKSVGVESKYVRWAKVIGGVVMLVIGILLIFKPDLLLFG